VICFHGTTRKRAEKICTLGFLPKKPSRRVWFANGKGYALRRARHQARRSHDRPVVLTCDIDVQGLKRRLGSKRIRYGNGILAIDAPLPVTVLRSHPVGGVPCSPEELTEWVNALLGLKRGTGVSRRHPGIERLSRWVNNRVTTSPDSRLREMELVQMARQWLPEVFKDFQIDAETLKARRTTDSATLEVLPPEVAADPLEDEALACLADAKPKRRVRGLRLLARLEDAGELFDWCVMYLADDSTDVRVAVLRAMLGCDDVDVEVVEPLTESADGGIRGGAIAVLAKHAGEAAVGWFARGLKDPSPGVRVATAALLEKLDPAEHRPIFELALHDPNPDVARRAWRLAEGKGYPKTDFRPG